MPTGGVKMDITNLTSLALLQNKMKYHADRQEAISQNIANVDTPKYRRQDIRKPDFSKMVKHYQTGVELETTHANHIASTNMGSNISGLYETEDKVTLDSEALEMMENRLDYNSATATYKKILTILKDVANSNK